MGVEKLLAQAGVALLVALVRPQSREFVVGAFEGGFADGWRQLLSYARAALQGRPPS